MHNYVRVLSRIANAPLFLSEDKLSILSTNVILPILTSGKPFSDSGLAATDKSIPETADKTAIIKVFDSLVGKGGAGESGFTSYETITNEIKAAIGAGSSKIGFYIDSHGGEVSGLFSLTDLINSLPSVYGIETFSFTDGSATSAAYAIASSTQKIYSTSTASLGSIGVVMSLVDVTKLDEKAGISYTILRSKSEKALFNPHEGVTQAVIDKYSTILEELDSIFNAKVTDYRSNLFVKDIMDMNGNTFLAEKALSLGLVDQIVSNLDEAISTEFSSTKPTTIKGNIMTLDELKAQVSALEAEKATLQSSVTNLVAKAIADERVRCLDILAAGKTLKISGEQVTKRISAGTSKDDSLDVFTAIAEAVGNITSVDTTTNLNSTLDNVAPLVQKFEVAGMEVTASDILNAAKGVK